MSEKVEERKMCKCGKSNDKPYCDGSHKVKNVDFGKKEDEISDEDFQVFLKAFFGPNERRGRGTE